MFDRKNVKHYLLAISLLLVATYIGNSYKNYVNKDTTNYEYDMIKEYLLNDSPLYGMNKPKLWIHSKYKLILKMTIFNPEIQLILINLIFILLFKVL